MSEKDKKKYCLCVELVINGKKKLICLAKYDLVTLQKYTSFCSDASELLKFMPEDETFSSRKLISSNLKEDILSSDPFTIRNSDSFNSKKIPILYKKDVDTLLLSKEEVIDAIINKYSFLLDDIKNDAIKDDVKQFLINMWNSFYDKSLKNDFYTIIENELNDDKPQSYDSRYEKILNNNWMILGVSKSFLKKFINFVWKDTKKRFEFISFINKCDPNLLPKLSYEEKKKRLSQLEQDLNEKGITTHRIRKRIMKNVKSLVPTKTAVMPAVNVEPSVISESEILKYNKSRNDINPVLNRILYLSENLENLRAELLVTKNINIRKELEEKITEIEFQIYELENNKYFYTDSGELIKEDEMKM